MIEKLASYVRFTRRCAGLLAGNRFAFSAFIVLCVLAAVTEGIGISLLAPLLDSQGVQGGLSGMPLFGNALAFVSGMSTGDRVKLVALCMAVVLLLRNILQYSVDSMSGVLPLQIEQKFNLRSYNEIINAEIDFTNRTEYGVLIDSINGWPARITDLLSAFSAIIANILTVLIYVALMLAVSWKLTLLSVFFMACMSWMLKSITGGILYRIGQRWASAAGRVYQINMETLSGMRVIKLAAAESIMTDRYSEAVSKSNSYRRTLVKIQALTSPLLSTFAGWFICVLLFGSAVVHSGETSNWVAPILMFLFLLFRLLGPVSAINSARSRIVAHMPALDLLTNFYAEMTRSRKVDGRLPAVPLERAMTFENVIFSYAADDKPAIDGLSMTFERGKMVAIVGPSGAGKSTLINLITRLYEPQQGKILFDGVDLREFEVHSWRRRLAVVSQDTFIFNDTVANNICFAQGDVSRGRLENAVRLASADAFVKELPQGYDTLLGDRGVRLSGGQQQRISIARAILMNPDILILDEATSHLDTFSERAIQEAIEKMATACTLIVIAHRLSTIRKADKVVVMEDGKIVEVGPHRDLLAARGRYWEMVEHQRLDFVDRDDSPMEIGIQ